MSAQDPNSAEAKRDDQPKNDAAAGAEYVAPSIEKTNRLAEVTGAVKMTGPV